MLKEAMLAMRITNDKYKPEVCRLLKSAEKDLRIAGVKISGKCAFEITESTNQQTNTTTVTVTDRSTIRDENVQTAMFTYCRIHFGSPQDRDKLEASYDLQRRQLANATGYTDFGESGKGEDGLW